MSGIGIGLAPPFYSILFGSGLNPQVAIDEIIAVAGASLFQYQDGSTYDDATGNWPDSSGNSRELNTASGGTDPAKGNLNGRPAVQFDTNTRMDASTAASVYAPLLDRTRRVVAYIVCDMDDAAGADMTLFNMGASSGSGRFWVNVNWGSSERVFTQLNDNTGGVARSFGIGAISSSTGVRNMVHKAFADTDASAELWSDEGNGTTAFGGALAGPAPASLSGTLVLGGLSDASFSQPMDGPVSAFIILENPTAEQEAAVETVLRERYLGQGNILSLGPAAWFQPADIVESGGSVTDWNDSSNWNQVVSTPSSPSYVASGINGLPAIQGDGTESVLVSSLAQGSLTQPIEIFVVARWTSSASAIMLDGPGASTRIILRNTGGNAGMFSGTSNVAFTGITTPSNGEPTIVSLQVDGASSVPQFITATTDETGSVGSNPGANGITGIYIGTDNAGLNGWDQEISEVIYFPRKLTTLERNQVLTYLANKYGLPAPLV